MLSILDTFERLAQVVDVGDTEQLNALTLGAVGFEAQGLQTQMRVVDLVHKFMDTTCYASLRYGHSSMDTTNMFTSLL